MLGGSPQALLARELAEDAFANLLALRQRSLLALLGIAIGAASVIATLAVGHMAGLETQKLFKAMGVDTLVIQARTSDGSVGHFEEEWISDLPRVNGHILAIAPMALGELPIGRAGGGTRGPIIGATSALASLAGLRLARGRFISEADDHSQVVILGADLAKRLAMERGAPDLGTAIRVGGYVYTVIGLLAPGQATAFDPANFNDAAYVPLDMAGEALGSARPTAALARMKSGSDDRPVSAAITADLKKKDVALDVQVQSARRLAETMKAQKAVHTRLLAAIGAISLLVGGIGVMNVSLMGVLERQREIGLRVAVGATPSHVQYMFLMEAGVLALVGGALGGACGVLVAAATAYASHWSFDFPLYTLPLGAGVATVVGLLFGLYPAAKAARLSPVDALRAA